MDLDRIPAEVIDFFPGVGYYFHFLDDMDGWDPRRGVPRPFKSVPRGCCALCRSDGDCATGGSSVSVCAGTVCDFARDYEIAQSPVMLEIERSVRDADYGATSWTTRAQAEQTAARLQLARGQCLLDIGAGSGWPGLFLAKLSGCDAVLTDLPLSGLRIARSRAERDGLQERCATVAADGAALPFADRSFERIHHADVLCCMERKQALLTECRRVATPGARMEFSVIWLVRAPSSADDQALLQQSGPAYPDAGADYASLLHLAAWRLVERLDVTAEFARCLDVLLEASEARRARLVALLGEQDFAERLVRRHSTRAAIARGLLRREIFVAS